MHPTVGQFVAKPASSIMQATTDSPPYAMPVHFGSARQDAVSLWTPHGSPAGEAHQSDGFHPHGPADVAGEDGLREQAAATATSTRTPTTAGSDIRRACHEVSAAPRRWSPSVLDL